ncbi:MAG: hypothetical protein L0226_17925 [Acidobacteria bacterium]|nr:hypothetical protein [Acidobacteriota bacterium]
MTSLVNGGRLTAKPVDPEEMKEALERVLSSKYFAHAPMKQRFLRLICEYHLSGRGGELNEYLIGQEVFDRDSTYNPATDPIVRVGAHGVREKLELYYQKEGGDDEIRIVMPVGSYNICFVRHSPQKPEENQIRQSQVPPVDFTPAIQKRSGWRLLHYLIVAALAIAVAVLIYSNLQLQRQVALATTQKELDVYRLVWEPFLKFEGPTLMVLSNPPVFRFINPTDPVSTVNKSIPLTSEQTAEVFEALPNKTIIQIIKNPRLILISDTYTGIGEAIGVHRVTGVFRTFDKNISLKQSRTVSVEDLKNQNVIVLGSVWVNNWSGKLPAKEEFIYSNDVTVKNLNPRPGEEREYHAVFDQQNSKLIEDYAIVTVGPNISDRDQVMIIAGLHSEGTAAAAEYVTSKHYLRELNQRLLLMGGKSGAPKYYQALLKAGVDNGIPTTISLVSVHALRNSTP